MPTNYPTSFDTFTNPTATSLLTSPSHAQQHADINDAVEALEAKVAIGNTVLGTYSSYTPTWTNLTVGNGTLVAKVARVNNLVHVLGYLTFGSTTVVTGDIDMSVPINMSTVYSGVFGQPGAFMHYFDVSSGTYFIGGVQSVGSSTVVRLRVYNASTAYVAFLSMSATVPFTWATGDRIYWNMVYEAA